MKNKYKIVQEFHNGDVCYVGYRYKWGIFPVQIPDCISISLSRCEALVNDYNYCRKPWYKILRLSK